MSQATATQVDPYFVDFPQRMRSIQAAMAQQGIDVYLGSRLRTLSWTLDAFCPWRSYVVIPPEGLPTAITFVIDAARVADDSWLDEDHVWGYGPMGGQDQVSLLCDLISPHLPGGKGVVGIESGMATYLPEGNLTQYEYERLTAALPDAQPSMPTASWIACPSSRTRAPSTAFARPRASWTLATRLSMTPSRTAATGA